MVTLSIPVVLTSSQYLQGIIRALRKKGHYEAVRALLGPESAQVLEKAESKRWWPASQTNPVVVAIEQVGGGALVFQVSKSAMAESLGPVVSPLVSVVLALSGMAPQQLFSRLGQLSSVSVKNVEFEWKATAQNGAGNLTVKYAETMPKAISEIWRGVFDYCLNITKHSGTSTLRTHLGGTFVFELNWKPMA